MQRRVLGKNADTASTHHGNLLSYEEQRRKLERVVEVAREVWG